MFWKINIDKESALVLILHFLKLDIEKNIVIK